MKQVKGIPYGIANFEQVINRNYYYVDKTLYLPLLEQAPNNLLLIRPRRFGKSLFIGMMRAYYDILQKDKFNDIFGELWIGKQPTNEQGMYQVLYFDFSKVGGAASIESLEASFDAYCGSVVDVFAEKYAAYYSTTFVEELKRKSTAREKLNFLDINAQARSYPLYLIVDEYDNFTNIVLSAHGQDMFHRITHAEGFYRDVFKLFKGMFYRIFLTGVSPVTLDDLTSGFNIDWNISNDPRFNAMLGFSETDVREMFSYYQENGQLNGDIETMIEEMKPWYDNYCFSQDSLDEPRMFNCDTTLYYLQHCLRSGHAPREMLSKNMRTDYSKLKMLVQIDKDITLKGQRMSTIEEITTQEEILVNLKTSFPVHEMTNQENYRSLLYYYGLLTISGTRGNRLRMRIPNNSVREQYFGFMREYYQQRYELNLSDLAELIDGLAYDGEWRPLFNAIGEAYHNNSSVRDSIQGERNIQGFLKAYLSLATYYLVMPELEMSYGYNDLALLPNKAQYPDVEHSYLIEIKYAKADATEAEMEAQRIEGRAQLLRYSQDRIARHLAEGTTTHLLLLQFKTWEQAVFEEIEKK
ncbi:MAG: ATP-binding protein [Mediterranea sp.]|jgi:hypothetical protein|nr:ATP-binding protein [Mediterranea sp.]